MKLSAHDDKWQKQKQVVPFGFAAPGTLAYEPYKEGASVSLNDAIKFLTEHGTELGIPPIQRIDMQQKTVVLSDGNAFGFDEIVHFVADYLTHKDADMGTMDGPRDLGKQPDGDFPSVEWMPSGDADKDVSSNATAGTGAVYKCPDCMFQTYDRGELSGHHSWNHKTCKGPHGDPTIKQAEEQQTFWDERSYEQKYPMMAKHPQMVDPIMKLIEQYGDNWYKVEQRAFYDIPGYMMQLSHEVGSREGSALIDEVYQWMEDQKAKGSDSYWLPRTYAMLKKAHCGPCTPLKMEAIKMLSDIQYKDHLAGLEDTLAALATSSTELDLSAFISHLSEGIKRVKDAKDKTKLEQIKLLLEDTKKHMEDGSVVAVTKPATEKKADRYSGDGFWADPNGQLYPVNETHENWVWQHKKELAAMGIDFSDDKIMMGGVDYLISKGWARIATNESQVGIQTENEAALDKILSQVGGPRKKVYVNNDLIFDPAQKPVEATLKTAETSPVDKEQQDIIAAQYGPEYNTALVHFQTAIQAEHPVDRAFEYAINAMTQVGFNIDGPKLAQVIDTYLKEQE
jgi:hypothetical protein